MLSGYIWGSKKNNLNGSSYFVPRIQLRLILILEYVLYVYMRALCVYAGATAWEVGGQLSGIAASSAT